ncbi:hypothetical protein QBC47DRAFT_405750 [Echria macrotheca]|uniref:Uncharacterized protein n=1 Tax=Echria macrotheca TaxID=438768 RepID=A0AAJ0B5S1_9PEZI|nr:hypothetical protein QBC47DRAFT_405750 [Echria macrotheca]
MATFKKTAVTGDGEELADPQQRPTTINNSTTVHSARLASRNQLPYHVLLRRRPDALAIDAQSKRQRTTGRGDRPAAAKRVAEPTPRQAWDDYYYQFQSERPSLRSTDAINFHGGSSSDGDDEEQAPVGCIWEGNGKTGRGYNVVVDNDNDNKQTATNDATTLDTADLCLWTAFFRYNVVAPDFRCCCVIGCCSDWEANPLEPARPDEVLGDDTDERDDIASAFAGQLGSGGGERLLRPAFNTHQQHYSPAKSLAPKPLTATFLAPPSPSKLPANVALSAETARLQTELLQLCLLHRDAGQVARAWRGSARTKLGQRFSELVEEDGAVRAAEGEVVERVNVAALVDWGRGRGRGGGPGLEGRIQTLDGILSGLWALGEPGTGRYGRVVRRFESWTVKVEEAWVLRREPGWGSRAGTGLEGVLVGELDGQWKDECAGLVRRLDEWRRQLREIDVDGGEEEGEKEESSLARILRGCRELIRDMLDELDVMEGMEREVVAEEMDWVRRVNREMDEGGNRARAGAIWRVA